MLPDQFLRQSFDPATLTLLYKTFDNVWKRIAPDIGATNRDHVRDAIAIALDMAKAGQLDTHRLEAFALARAHKACAP